MSSPSTQIPAQIHGQTRIPRSLHVALFLTGVLWLLAAHAIAVRASDGIVDRLHWFAAQMLLSDGFFLFLLLLGFSALGWLGMRQGGVRRANALPRRSTAAHEWSSGAVIGWAALLLAVLPMMLFGALHPEFLWAPSNWGAMILSTAALAVGALASEVAFRGFLFRRLIDAIGPAAATLLLSGLYAVLVSLRPNATSLSLFVAFIAGLLFSLAYLRTHALWLGWGLHFAWAAATVILFGLPIGGIADYTSIVQTEATGPGWFTGGAFGPDGALFTGLVLLLAMVAVYRATRDYAWNYTQPEILPGGYPMDVPPPAAHAAMQPAPPPLVQIVPAQPATPADTSPSSDETLPS